MRIKKAILILAILTLCSAPSWAGSFDLYGSYWDSKDFGGSFGVGARVGFDLTKRFELEFRGSYYPNFNNNQGLNEFDLKATPIDGGFRFNFTPDKKVNPYVAVGASYYFFDIDPGESDNKTGVYLGGGLEIGEPDHVHFVAEALWRKVDVAVAFGSFDDDVSADGISINAGAQWRWGK